MTHLVGGIYVCPAIQEEFHYVDVSLTRCPVHSGVTELIDRIIQSIGLGSQLGMLVEQDMGLRVP